jgi:hypothetical protein
LGGMTASPPMTRDLACWRAGVLSVLSRRIPIPTTGAQGARGALRGQHCQHCQHCQHAVVL